MAKVPSDAFHDFALTEFSDFDFDRLGQHLDALRAAFAERPPRIELFGRPDPKEVVVLCRFAADLDTTVLRGQMLALSKRLRARLLEAEAPGTRERSLLLEAPVLSMPLRLEASEQPREAALALRNSMMHGPAPHAYTVAFPHAADLAAAWARSVVEGSLFVPARKPPKPGEAVALTFTAPDVGALPATGHVLEVEPQGTESGFYALVAPGQAMQEFLARRAAQGRAGRRISPDRAGRRQHARYEACLEVALGDGPHPSMALAANISRGGLFVRTLEPPPLGARVRLVLSLSEGEEAETEAEVVHRVTPEEARALRIPAGVGVRFVRGDPEFEERIASYLAQLPHRAPRVLLVDADRAFRERLAEALQATGVSVEMAPTGDEGLRKLAQQLFTLDLVVLDLRIPGLDGYCLIDRIRRLGGELGLRIVVVAAADADELEQLKGPDAADDAVHKFAPLEDVVRRVHRVLGLDAGVG